MIYKIIIGILIYLMFINVASANDITYNSVSKVITITGYTKIQPCDFEDLYNADIANGWGVIQQVSHYLYRTIGISFQVGNSTQGGWFGDIDKLIEIWDMQDMTGFIISPNNNGSCIFGNAASNTYQTGTNGCVFSFYSTGMVMDQWVFDNLKEIHFYNSHIYLKTPFVAMMVKVTGSNGSIWGSTFSNCYLTGQANNISINNVKMTDGFMGIWSYGTNGTSTNLEIENCNGFCIGYSTIHDSILKNLKISNSWNNLWMIGTTSNTINHTLIDCDIPWHLNKAFYDTGNAKVYRKNTFNLITDPNVKIIIRDNQSNIYIINSNQNGIIDEQLLTHTIYKRYDDIICNPHTLKISKLGYDTYYTQFNISEPISWEIMLQPTKPKMSNTNFSLFLTLAGMLTIGIFIKQKTR